MTALPNPRPVADPIAGRGIEKHFGDQPVLRGLDLEIPAGQFVAIIGRSGCGKSTLLRLIAGLDTPTGGSVSVGGDSAEAASATRLMFQEPRLLPWASVLRNVEVGLGHNRRTAGALGRAIDTLKSVGLDARAHDWPAVLSGGQKQRVALARALVSRPRVLALDEPLGALDALTRIDMQGLLERVWRDQGFTAVLVTHDVSEALALADRVILIEDGGIALDLEVSLPRPRRRGSIALAQLEERILKLLLKHDPGVPEYVI